MTLPQTASAVTGTHQPSKRLASLRRCAEYLSCEPRTIRRLIAGGHINGYRVGQKMLRVDLNELDAFLQPVRSASKPNGSRAHNS